MMSENNRLCSVKGRVFRRVEITHRVNKISVGAFDDRDELFVRSRDVSSEWRPLVAVLTIGMARLSGGKLAVAASGSVSMSLHQSHINYFVTLFTKTH